MNDQPSRDESNIPDTNIPENAGIAQLRSDASDAAGAPDLRERVRELTARALHERRMAFEDMRAIVGAITEGVGSGLSARGGEMKEGMRQAVAGLDEAVGSAVQATTYAIKEAVGQGRAFKDTELKDRLEELRDLESQIIETLKSTARQSGGKLKDELEYLSDHLKVSGTRTGEQVRDAMQQFAAGVKTGSAAGRAGLAESAGTASERLSQVASGILAALGDSLKRQSERLRS